MLGAAAVIGRNFTTITLARVAALARPELLALLDEAVAAGVLRPSEEAGDGYEFGHSLVQTTLYEALPRARRCQLHAAAGEALEQSYDIAAGEGLAEVAFHLLEAAPGGDARRAVEYARRAADRAVNTFAYDEAVTLYTRALELLDTSRTSERIAVLQALGEAQMRAGDTEGARDTLRRCASAANAGGDREGLARAALASNIWGLTFGVDEPLVRLAEDAVAQLQDDGSPGLLACVKGLLASALYYTPEAQRREDLAAEALELARRQHQLLDSEESARGLAYVLGRCLLARWGPDSADRDMELSDELIERCRALRNRELETLTRNWRITELLELGRFAAVDQEIARVEQMAGELRQPRAMVYLPLHYGSRAGTEGRFEQAERLNAESLEIGHMVRGTVGELAATAQLLAIRLQQGRLSELESAVRTLADRHPTMVVLRCVLALALVQSGRSGEGRAEFERLMAAGVEGVPRDNVHIVALAVLGETACELGEAGHAQALYEWMAPYHERWVVSPQAAALWPVDRSLARLATVARAYDTAGAHLQRARELAIRAGARPSIALTTLDEARLLLAAEPQPDAARVGSLARQARELAQELGMGLVVDAATVLESTG